MSEATQLFIMKRYIHIYVTNLTSLFVKTEDTTKMNTTTAQDEVSVSRQGLAGQVKCPFLDCTAI